MRQQDARLSGRASEKAARAAATSTRILPHNIQPPQAHADHHGAVGAELLRLSPRPDLILKGFRFIVHPKKTVGRRGGERVLSHVIYYPPRAGAAVSACGQHGYRLVGVSPHLRLPRFVDVTDQREQIAGTILRGHIPLDAICPDCLDELEDLAARGLVLPLLDAHAHPDTLARRAERKAARA
jgi:hypothetical protein